MASNARDSATSRFTTRCVIFSIIESEQSVAPEFVTGFPSTPFLLHHPPNTHYMVYDELTMLLRRAPRDLDVVEDRRIAIHGEAGVQVPDPTRANEEPLRFEAGQHGQESPRVFSLPSGEGRRRRRRGGVPAQPARRYRVSPPSPPGRENAPTNRVAISAQACRE